MSFLDYLLLSMLNKNGRKNSHRAKKRGPSLSLELDFFLWTYTLEQSHRDYLPLQRISSLPFPHLTYFLLPAKEKKKKIDEPPSLLTPTYPRAQMLRKCSQIITQNDHFQVRSCLSDSGKYSCLQWPKWKKKHECSPFENSAYCSNRYMFHDIWLHSY